MVLTMLQVQELTNTHRQTHSMVDLYDRHRAVSYEIMLFLKQRMIPDELFTPKD